MASYHLNAKAISRAKGRSATGAAAYRSGTEIADQRTGEVHDYHRKQGVESADIVLPASAGSWAMDRSELWNAAELAENRKDACVAREFDIALPHELTQEQRRELALGFAQDMASREGCAIDVCIHAPSPNGDERNFHAHMLRTTRKVEAEGLGEKLDVEKAGRKRKEDLEGWRAAWADHANHALERAGVDARIDHRSLEAQGINRPPEIHMGPTATSMERRGERSDRGSRNKASKALGRAAEAQEGCRRGIGLLEDAERGMDRSRARFMAKQKAMELEQEKQRQEEERRRQIEASQREARLKEWSQRNVEARLPDRVEIHDDVEARLPNRVEPGQQPDQAMVQQKERERGGPSYGR